MLSWINACLFIKCYGIWFHGMIMKLTAFISLQMVKKYESLAGSESVIENGNVFIIPELFPMRKAQWQCNVCEWI